MNLTRAPRGAYGHALTAALLQPFRVNAACGRTGVLGAVTQTFSEPVESPLPGKLFASIVKYAPLIAVDLVVQNESGEVLLGLRRNAPARGFWFVPGGRILKNEPIEIAVTRVARDELAFAAEPHNSSNLIGVFEHFYDDNFSGAKRFGTHYVVLAHRLKMSAQQTLSLPSQQHAGYRWLRPAELAVARDVHPYAKAYARHL